MVCQVNCGSNQTLQQKSCSSPCGSMQSGGRSMASQRQQPCGSGRATCPADIESRLQEYSANTQNLEFQLCNLENEVQTIQEELTAVQRERAHLEHHRKMICPPPPCFLSPCLPPPCVPVPPCLPSPCQPPPCLSMPCRLPPCMMPPPCTCAEDTGASAEQQVKELKVQYELLQEDYKLKLKEVSSLRAENQSIKEAIDTERANLKVYKDKIKKLEDQLRALQGDKGKGAGVKERLLEIEHELTAAKQKFREAQDELEELRQLVQDQQQQMDEYRKRYLEAQQLVEEQTRQIDLMEMENQRVSEQVNMEIQRVKNQFQQKVQELIPLPGILKGTQIKLQEAQQMHLLAERNNESMARQLTMYKDKLAALSNQLDTKGDEALSKDEKHALLQKIDDLEVELELIREENFSMTIQLADLNERFASCRQESNSRAHQIVQLESNIENVKEESARQVARTKDRCEVVRKSMQNEINELERQLALCQAHAKSAQKDRDEIREKMQAQICNLTENFEDATMRIRSLQGHLHFLKNTYGAATGDSCPNPTIPDPCSCGASY
nr:unnamed protein product [Callosobruchus analis]